MKPTAYSTHSVCQAVGAAYMVILEDDKFLEFFRKIETERTAKLACVFARTFLKCYQDAEGKCLMPLPMQEHRHLKILCSSLSNAANVCRMLLCLVDPADFGMHGDLVLNALEYRGARVFQKALRNIFSKEAPPNATPEQRSQATHILTLVKDIQRTAASLPTANGTFQKLRLIVQEKNPKHEDLRWAMEQQRYLLENLRMGQMKKVRQELAAHIVSAARELYMGGKTEGVDSSWVDFLMTTLRSGTFHRISESCVEAHNKLVAWFTKHNAEICKSDVCLMLQQYVANAELQSSRVSSQPLPVEKFMAALPKCKASQFYDDTELVQRAQAYLLKEAFAKVAMMHTVVYPVVSLGRGFHGFLCLGACIKVTRSQFYDLLAIIYFCILYSIQSISYLYCKSWTAVAS